MDSDVLIRQITRGFGCALSRLPVVFGVSQQTLYNWQQGEMSKEVYQAKLIQLAAAARTFSAAQFTPTSPMLDRTVAQGKSFLTLLAEGADGADAATRLMRIVQRDRAAAARFDAALPGRPKVKLTASDFGAEAFEEDAKYAQ
jgi:DNA-binding transcriptional regulator YiaG